MRIFVTGLALLSSVGVAQADCICLNRGVEVSEGKTACIQTSQGGKLALCEKNLNVTNWKFLGEQCPVAGRVVQVESVFGVKFSTERIIYSPTPEWKKNGFHSNRPANSERLTTKQIAFFRWRLKSSPLLVASHEQFNK